MGRAYGPERLARLRPYFFFHATFFNFRTLSQRALSARRIFSFRWAGVNLAAEAFPPIECVAGFVNGTIPVIPQLPVTYNTPTQDF